MQGRGRGIVSTCNYAAREYGVRSAMPISEAWRRCAGHPFGPARFIRGTRSLYSMASRRVMKILRNDADTFEQASIDEAYMDVTEKVDGDWDEAMALARRLQRAIHAKVGLTASFGIDQHESLQKCHRRLTSRMEFTEFFLMKFKRSLNQDRFVMCQALVRKQRMFSLSGELQRWMKPSNLVNSHLQE